MEVGLIESGSGTIETGRRLAAVDALQAQLAEVKGDSSSSKQLIAEGDRTIAAARDQLAATVGAVAAEAREEAAIRDLEQTEPNRTDHEGRERKERVQQQQADADSDERESMTMRMRSRRQQQQQQQ
jgi:hypothetical protein